MMFKRCQMGAFLLVVSLGWLVSRRAEATAIANSTLSLSNLQIISPVGTSVIFLDTWTAEAFAEAQNNLGELDSQFDSSLGGGCDCERRSDVC